mmetsp:Transcript_16009/g.41410  ORF Transcript_16009/g.41410 Transcript_16009/m.41410 type:complete len:232 (+) Transcript_16009:2838-3533(+)
MPQAVLGGLIILINFIMPLAALAVGWVCSVQHRRKLAEKEGRLEEGFTQEQKLKIEKARRELDEELDQITLQYVLLVFAVMAAAAFVAVAILLLGQFWQAATATVVAPTGRELGNQFAGVPGTAECEVEGLIRQNEFVGYKDWKEFTASCCCSDRQNEFSHGEEFEPKTVELWTCANGLLKERARGTKSGRIREFCSPKFGSNFELPSYASNLRQYVVRNSGTGEIHVTGW